MRVFLDTNVLVSAFATRGLCADLLRHVLVEHELVVGEVVIAELKRVLTQRLEVPRPPVDEIERLLRDHEVVHKPRAHLKLGLDDPNDEWVVASASAGEADVLVTGDADILSAADRIPMPVLSPRGFWNHLRDRN